MSVVRHLLAIALLPFVVVVVIPAWLLNTFAASGDRWAGGSPIGWLAQLLGALGIAAGFALFGWCVALFIRVGRGTLAPWDPTHNLVAVGPYRSVRNPMISGVALMLIGQALLWGSLAVGLWAGAFIVINHSYFVLSEEPGLEQRFGAPYRQYKATVPRWLPRWRRSGG